MPRRSANRPQPDHPRAAYRATVLAAALLVASPAGAVMVQRPQGTQVLGQPLHLDIPVRLDGSDKLDPACVQLRADVGEQSWGPERFVTTVQPGADGIARVVVRSREPVTEPFVDLTVKLTCRYQFTQHFTLLVNPPVPEQPAPMASGPLLTPLPPPVKAPAAPVVATPRPAPAAASRIARGRVRHPGEARPRVARHAAPAAVAHRAREVAPQANHLKLDWMSPSLVMPNLSMTPEMAASHPALTPAQREQAAKLRDIVMNGGADADKILQLSDRVAALDARLASLDKWRQQQTGHMHAEQAEQATRAGASGFWLMLLGGVAALLAALVAALLWRERQRRSAEQAAWFVPGGTPAPDAPASVFGNAPSSAPRASAARAAARQPIVEEPPTTLPPMLPSTQLPSMMAPLQPPPPAPARAAAPAAAAAWGQGLSLDREVFSRPLSGQEQVQVDEMMDTGHLADFFISIGNFDQAIDVMRKALTDRAGGMLALPYLYLFDLYRKTGNKAEYEALLEQFAHRFNVHIPAWDEPAEGEARDLESYPRAIALICETWDMPPMVTVIERMLLDDPNKPRVGFDLPAYRDLLDLYAVARDLARNPARAEPVLTQELEPAQRPMPPSADLDFPLDLGTAPASAVPGAAPAQPPKLLEPLDFTLDDLPSLKQSPQ